MRSRYTGPAFFIAAFMTTFLVAGGIYSDSAQAVLPTIPYTLDAPRTLMGPSSGIDNAANTLGSRLYVGNVSTQGYTLPDAPLALQGTVLSPGAAGSGTFDDCGAWLDTTWPDGALVRAIYHAEYVPAGASCSQAHRMSVGYAESTDGGATFTKPGYPNNQIISGPDAYSASTMTGEGQPYVRVGQDGYLYLYFQVARDSWTVHVARALISSGGLPGTWTKLYAGAWTEPGLGGQSTKLASGTVLGRSWVDYSGALGKYVGIAWTPTGFGMAASTDGLTGWQVVIPQFLDTSHNWGNRSSDATPLIDYPSLLGTGYTTGAGLGSDIQVTYMYVPPYRNVGANRTLQVRTLHLQGTPTPTTVATATATVTATSTPTAPPTATQTGVPSSTATSTLTATTTPTDTPTAMGTPTPGYIECTARKRLSDGVIEVSCP